MSELTGPFAGPMSRGDADRLATLMKAIAEPARLQLLSLLVQGEATVQQLTEWLGYLTQQTVSHHLDVLAVAGLIERRRDGVWMVQQLVPEAVAAVGHALRPGVRR